VASSRRRSGTYPASPSGATWVIITAAFR